jgi:hypothetical protein
MKPLANSWHRARVLHGRIRKHLARGGIVLVATCTEFWIHDDPDHFQCRPDGVYVRRGKQWDCISGWVIRFY